MSFDFQLSDEHKLVKTAVGTMLQKYDGRRQELREIAKQKQFPQELWEDFARVGLTGCLVPEQYGGNNMGLLALTLGFEEVCSNGFSPGLLLVVAMDSACILKNGSDEIKARYLPKIADGSMKTCFALTEPNAGTNTFKITTSARKNGDGSYIVNGQKIFITGVDIADHMLLVARTTSLEELEKQGLPKSHGITLFLVDTKSPGISMQPIPIPLSEELTQFQLFFDNVEVPGCNVIGEVDKGAIAMFNSLNPERILAAAICTGMAEYALNKAVAYAKERKVFGDKPIGAYQGIAHPLAEVKIGLEAAKLLTYRAAWAFDNEVNPLEVGNYANMAKCFAADLAIKSVDHAIETHGGLAFAEETGLIGQWSGARLLKTAPVSREMILNYVAEWTLGLPRSY